MFDAKKTTLLWLCCVMFFIFALVIVGGVTRLTHSGLSMVEWHPLMGILPPLNEAAWNQTFLKYQQFPEYQLINNGMSLFSFKSIFLWEYFHRLLGRLVGLVFFIPWVLLFKRLNSKLNKNLSVVALLGGAQGLMGWYMVKSGLINVPYVSHYRLAIHLALAFILICYLFWIVLDIIGMQKKGQKGLPFLSYLITGLVSLQIIYGAFTAGLKAGLGHNTFPRMSGEWFPTAFFTLDPWWINLFENNTAVQFIHRTLGWLILVLVIYFWFSSRKFILSSLQKWSSNLLLGFIVIQFLLGVFTLLYFVPISLASIHQAGALILLVLSIFANRFFGQRRYDSLHY